MNWHEIAKYNPSNYADGIYTVDEWTSMSDVGKCYHGIMFALEDYLKVEQQYLDAVLSILCATGCKYMSIQYLEADRNLVEEQIKSSKNYNSDAPLLKSLPKLQVNKRIGLQEIDQIIRLNLREYIYAVLVNKKHQLKIEFGYDYYLRVCTALDDATLRSIVGGAGLFLDPR